MIIFDVFLDMTNAVDRSYLVDSIATRQSYIGNSIFSALTNASSCMGGIVSSLDWEKIFKLSTGGQTKVVFITIILVLFVCVILTLSSVKEPHIGKDGEMQQYSSNSKCYVCCNYFAFDLYKKSIGTMEYELQQTEPLSSDEQTVDSVIMINEDPLISLGEHGSESKDSQ